MGILIIVGVGLLAILLLLFMVVRVMQTVGLFVIFVFGAAVLAIGYVGVFIASISAAVLFQWWGADHAGWAIAVAGVIGLSVAWAMFRALLDEVRSFPARIKCWLGWVK